VFWKERDPGSEGVHNVCAMSEQLIAVDMRWANLAARFWPLVFDYEYFTRPYGLHAALTLWFAPTLFDVQPFSAIMGPARGLS
jgi:hypothetical protein